MTDHPQHIPILAQERSKSYSEGFRAASCLSYEDAYESGREAGYHDARVPLWRFFVVFLVGVAVGAVLL